MKKILLTMSLLFFTPLFYSQVLEMPKIKIVPTYKGEYKVIIGATTSIPPHSFERVEGYKYQIEMELSFKENISNISDVYGIVCKMPGFEIKKLLFIPDSLLQVSPHSFKYSFPLLIKEKGWVSFFVTESENFSKELDVDFYKSRSNLESYLLNAW